MEELVDLMPFVEALFLGDELVVRIVEVFGEASEHSSNAKIVFTVTIEGGSIKDHRFVLRGCGISAPKVSVDQGRFDFINTCANS